MWITLEVQVQTQQRCKGFYFLFFFQQLHVLSRALISTFQETIPNDWVPEVAAAWELLLNYFTVTLKEGIRSSVQ